MAQELLSLGIDIGGSSVKMGVVARSGEILVRAEEPVDHELPAEKLVENLISRIHDLLNWKLDIKGNTAGIGVSVCGIIHPSGDRPDYVNVHSLDGFPLRERLEKEFGYPVILDCDMNCGALGEYYYGGERRESRLMVMTVGTGIGMGMIVDGQVVRTNAGTTGNPGHIIVDPAGPACVAGCRGCLESLASAPVIVRRAENIARSQRPTLLKDMLAERGRLSTEDVFQAAELGDAAAQEIWDFTGTWLGRGLASWVGIFGPEIVRVGGGVALAGEWLLKPMVQEMRRTGEPYFTSRVKAVELTKLGVDMVMLGAACLVNQPIGAHSP
jgi:glucokinase